jgi:hypothetical protein
MVEEEDEEEIQPAQDTSSEAMPKNRSNIASSLSGSGSVDSCSSSNSNSCSITVHPVEKF